jgi:hypothetical protein
MRYHLIFLMLESVDSFYLTVIHSARWKIYMELIRADSKWKKIFGLVFGENMACQAEAILCHGTGPPSLCYSVTAFALAMLGEGLVRPRRLELPRDCSHSDLNAARLPFRHGRGR